MKLRLSTLFLIISFALFSFITPVNAEDIPGIPSTDPDFSEDAETWWNSHPMNPDNSSGFDIGYVPNPPEIIEIDPDGGCGSGTAIQDALDNLPDVPTQGYTFQLSAGTYCGDFRIANDYTSNGSGGFTQTLKRDNIHFLGDSGGGTIFEISHHYASESDYDNAYADRVELEILGCPEAADYAGFSASRNPANASHDKGNYCIENPIHNIYFNNIIFDGDATSAILVHFAAARDVVFDNFTIRNTSGSGIGVHDGSMYGVATVTNIWCRGCTFDGSEEYQTYIDGLHGGGIIYSSIGSKTTSGGNLYLTNDDFTRDRDGSDTVEESEYGIGNYIVNYKNTYTGRESSSTYNAISLVGANSLIKGNLVNGKVNSLVYFNPKSSRISQYGGITPTIAQYYFTESIIKDNKVRSANQLVYVEQSGDVCNPTDTASTYNAGKCAYIGDHTISGNNIYQHNTSLYVKETYNSDYEAPDRILASTLTDNCASGGDFADGDTAASSGNPQPAVSTTVACSSSIPTGPSDSAQNLLSNSSFETGTTFPTSWQQRSSATFDTLNVYSGSKSLKFTGAASGIYVNYTGNLLASLESNTEYFMNARVKASTIATPASSFFRLRFNDITNGATTNSANVTTTATYWKYLTTKVTTANSTSNVRFDLYHTLEVNDAVYVDDVEFYKVSNHAEQITEPAGTDSTAPTGSLSITNSNVSSSPVTLALSASDNKDSSSTYMHMRLSEDSGFSGASWQWFSSAPSFSLSGGNGSKTVYAQFRDVHGNLSDTYSLALNLSSGSSSSSSNSSSNSSTVSSAPSGSCSASSPAGIPDLFQIDTTQNSALLYFAPVNGATSYTVSYGYSKSASDFSTQVSSTGAVIGNLAPQTTYYFKMRALNDCVPGDWGSVMQVTTNSAISLRKNVFYKSSAPIINKPLQQPKSSAKISAQLSKPDEVSPSKPADTTPEVAPNELQKKSTPPVINENSSWFGSLLKKVKSYFGF